MNNLTIDINAVCNLACRFCYQDLDGSILSKDDILGIADANPGFDTVEIGGGEPFLHKDIIDIISGLQKRGRHVHIATNATRIPEGFLDLEEIMRENIRVQVSLHASNSQLYEKITGKDIFDKVLENTAMLKSRYSSHISSIVYQENFEDVPGIVNLADELTLPIRFNLVYPIRKEADVDLLNPVQVGQLRGYLLGQRLQKGSKIESPLLHTNNCAALECYYGIPKKNFCPVDFKTKKYISPKREEYACEFVR